MRPRTAVQLHLGVAGRVALTPGALTAAATLSAPGLTVAVDPATAALTVAHTGSAHHYWRWADGTLKPLPAGPAPLTLARGDAYIAVLAGDPPAVASVTIARFLHLRDYFNAQRLAEALLA